MENQQASLPPIPQQPATPATPPPAQPTHMENALGPRPFYKSKFFIFFGLILLFGLIFGGAYFALMRGFGPKPEEPKLSVAPTSVPQKPFDLVLESPTDGVSLDSNVLMVKGKTSPNTTVSYFTEDSEEVVESDANGNFSGNVLLKNGINTLIVTAYSETEDEKSVTVDVVYDEEEVLAASISLAKNDNGSTQSNKQESEKGKSKKDEKPLVGSVSEVSNDKVVVEDKKTKQKLESSHDGKTKVIGKENKPMKAKDIKPKDLVAVIGSDSAKMATPGGSLKKALKIFVKTASESATMKRRSVHGIVNAINGNQVTIVHQIHTDRVFTFAIDANTVVRSKSEVVAASSSQIGQRVVAVGELTETGLVAKLIKIIPGKAVGVMKKNPVASGSGVLTPTVTTTPSATLAPTATEAPTPTTTETP